MLYMYTKSNSIRFYTVCIGIAIVYSNLHGRYYIFKGKKQTEHHPNKKEIDNMTVIIKRLI